LLHERGGEAASNITIFIIRSSACTAMAVLLMASTPPKQRCHSHFYRTGVLRPD
jgi:hypothetical protein